jgi:murein DD-endopeptidase MepM/ murein hydrolase activator NlpD
MVMRNLRALISPLFAAVLLFHGPPVIGADGPKQESNSLKAIVVQLERQYREPLEVAERLLIPEHAKSIVLTKDLVASASTSTPTEPPAFSMFTTLNLNDQVRQSENDQVRQSENVSPAVEPSPMPQEPPVVTPTAPPPVQTHTAASAPTSTALTWQWPTKSHLITDAFGVRRGNGYHGGIDIADSWKAQVWAIGPGVVTFAGNQGATYGLSVLIQHPNGWVSRYGHLSGIYVRTGDRVVGGKLIGQMGDSGYAFGTHLHLEVIANGSVINPLTVLPR